MFDQLKQLKQIKDLQGSLRGEKIEIEEEGVRVVVNGKMEIEKVELNNKLSKEKQEKLLEDCINKALKELQTRVLKKMVSTNPFI